MTTTTATDITSISLSAGDWDIFGNVFISTTGTGSQFLAWTSLTSATLPDASLLNGITAPTANNNGIEVPYLRVNVSTTTTVYLTGYVVFAAGTAAGAGSIFARRVR
jgi:hypothetical protein